ncbi:MAG: hypothetical protein QOG77_2704, partial [Solirubrobacteraceae bacterium]|nr:hypothetical protein [Solirubrobacteraceae bacterium]
SSQLVATVAGVRNRFYTVAVDHVGNRETPPANNDRSRARTL